MWLGCHLATSSILSYCSFLLLAICFTPGNLPVSCAGRYVWLGLMHGWLHTSTWLSFTSHSLVAVGPMWLEQRSSYSPIPKLQIGLQMVGEFPYTRKQRVIKCSLYFHTFQWKTRPSRQPKAPQTWCHRCNKHNLILLGNDYYYNCPFFFLACISADPVIQVIQ